MIRKKRGKKVLLLVLRDGRERDRKGKSSLSREFEWKMK